MNVKQADAGGEDSNADWRETYSFYSNMFWHVSYIKAYEGDVVKREHLVDKWSSVKIHYTVYWWESASELTWLSHDN